jgi:hypothetical protein
VPNTSVNFSRTGTGSAAPPDSADLSFGRCSEVFAASSSPTYIVGTPMKIVQDSFASSSRACAPSKRGSMTTLAPTKKAVFMQHVWPKVWNSGRQPRTTSSFVMSNE